MEVLVLLHVQVDEGVRVALHGLAVQRAQAILQAFNGALEVPVVQLADHGGSLDGNVVHPRVLQQVEGVIQASLCLGLAEHGLAQQVQVQLEALVAVVVQHAIQRLGFRIQHQVADGGAQVGARDRHDDVRQQWRCDGTGGNQDGIDQAHEPRHWLGALKRVGDLGKLLGRNVVVLGAGHAVDEGEGELHAVGIVHHVCQLLRGSGSLFDLQPLLGAVNGLGDHRFDIGAIG